MSSLRRREQQWTWICPDWRSTPCWLLNYNKAKASGLLSFLCSCVWLTFLQKPCTVEALQRASHHDLWPDELTVLLGLLHLTKLQDYSLFVRFFSSAVSTEYKEINVSFILSRVILIISCVFWDTSAWQRCFFSSSLFITSPLCSLFPLW